MMNLVYKNISERSILSEMLHQSELDTDYSKHSIPTQLTFILPLLKSRYQC